MDLVRRPPELVERLRAMIEDDPSRRVGDKDLAALGIDPSTARRQFRRYLGMTFQSYQRSRRLGESLRHAKSGSRLLEVGLDAGYASSGAFRDAFARLFGRPPRDARDAGGLFARRVETPLGAMLALADDEGVRLLDFLDRPDLAEKARALGESLGLALIHADHPHLEAVAGQLEAYFAGRRLAFDVPLAPIGTAWQRAVWGALRAIPPGETRSYSGLASTLGRPGASRAVGMANGRNPIGVVVPCHRVIRADGSLCGYAGGPWRKQWLLDHERAALDGRTSP